MLGWAPGRSWTWTEKVLHTTDALHDLCVTCNASISGEYLWGQFRKRPVWSDSINKWSENSEDFGASFLKGEERSVERHGSLPSASTYQSVYFTQNFLILLAEIITLRIMHHIGGSTALQQDCGDCQTVADERIRKCCHIILTSGQRLL